MQTCPAPQIAEDFRQAIIGVLRGYVGTLSSDAMFAVTCQLAGQIAAHFDPSRVTRDDVMQLLNANFIIGNAAAVEAIISQNGGRH